MRIILSILLTTFIVSISPAKGTEQHTDVDATSSNNLYNNTDDPSYDAYDRTKIDNAMKSETSVGKVSDNNYAHIFRLKRLIETYHYDPYKRTYYAIRLAHTYLNHVLCYEALDTLKYVDHQYRNSEAYLTILGMCKYFIGHYEHAYNIFQKLVNANSPYKTALYGYRNILLGLLSTTSIYYAPERAVALLNSSMQYIETLGKNIKAYIVLRISKMYINMGKYRRAIQVLQFPNSAEYNVFSSVLENSPFYQKYYKYLMIAHYMQKNYSFFISREIVARVMNGSISYTAFNIFYILSKGSMGNLRYNNIQFLHALLHLLQSIHDYDIYKLSHNIYKKNCDATFFNNPYQCLNLGLFYATFASSLLNIDESRLMTREFDEMIIKYFNHNASVKSINSYYESASLLNIYNRYVKDEYNPRPKIVALIADRILYSLSSVQAYSRMCVFIKKFINQFIYKDKTLSSMIPRYRLYAMDSYLKLGLMQEAQGMYRQIKNDTGTIGKISKYIMIARENPSTSIEEYININDINDTELLNIVLRNMFVSKNYDEIAKYYKKFLPVIKNYNQITAVENISLVLSSLISVLAKDGPNDSKYNISLYDIENIMTLYKGSMNADIIKNINTFIDAYNALGK